MTTVEQPQLPPFARRSETSRKAAIAAYPKAGSKRRIVFDFIKDHPFTGATDDEGIAATGQVNGYRARRGELAEMGLIKMAGFTRKTRAGLDAEVWVAT